MTPVEHAANRLAFVFKIDRANVLPEMRFGHELISSVNSDWNQSELSRILDDIQEMQAVTKCSDEIEHVSDFFNLTEKYATISIDNYNRLIASWNKEMIMSNRKDFRGFVYRFFGF